MAMNWPTFFTRLGTAVLFCALMLTGLLYEDWAFFLLVCLIMVLCLQEFFKLAGKIIQVEVPAWLRITAIAFTLAACTFMAAECHITVPDIIRRLVRHHEAELIITLFLTPVMILLVATLSAKNYFLPALAALGALAYIMVPGVLLLPLYAKNRSLPLALILMIWTNDTMAYIVGSFIGKTPFSSISPKKTWEGTAGGAMLTLAGAAVAAHFIPNQSMMLYLGLAICAAVAGTAGDLFESKLKRMAGVKDSGSLMPGHGGALDRFDSLLVAAPFAFCWAYLCS